VVVAEEVQRFFVGRTTMGHLEILFFKARCNVEIFQPVFMTARQGRCCGREGKKGMIRLYFRYECCSSRMAGFGFSLWFARIT